jgi:transposase-like protein
MKRHSLSLIEVEREFGTEEQCLAYAAAARWPEGVRCLKCDSDKVSSFKTNETEREVTNRKGVTETRRVPARHLYQCNAEGCRHQFSAIAGTIFSDTHLPLSTWFKAIALLANAKKSISALQMSRDLNVNYRTAWHLNHRIREAMQSEQGIFGGTVEVDATFHGGRYDPRRKRAAYDKQAVAGIIQRTTEAGHSKVKALPVIKEIAKVMTEVIRANVARDAAVMTDDHGAYRALSTKGYKHEIVAHSKEEWTRGAVHTQGIENFWSLFKRQIVGQHHHVSVKHLHRYLDECAFKFNNREAENIFGMIVLSLVTGKPLRYDALTAPVSDNPQPEA